MKKVTRRSEEEIKKILSTQNTSGLSVKEFCIDHQICESTFWNWRKRYGKCKAASATQKPVKFLELGHMPTVSASEIEIHLGPVVVRVNRSSDSQLLTTVLSTLAQLYGTSHKAAACN